MINIESKKTTRLNTTVVWKKTLSDENGVVFAIMSATADERRPLGASTFNIVAPEIYEKYADAAQEEYKAFQAAVIDECKSISMNKTIIE